MPDKPSPKRGRRPGLPELLLMGVSVAAQAWIVWVSLPPQQRFWIRLALLGRLRSLGARLAWLEGRAGMAEEIQTGQRTVRYVSAYGLSLVRDAAAEALEDMRS